MLNKPPGSRCRVAPRPRIISIGCSKAWGRPETRPRLVHRLDRDTSGVLVVAKRREVAAKLGRAFQTRSVRKIYWALVKGVPKPPQGKVDAALVKASGPEGDRVRKARPGEQEVAQSAVTYYAVVDRAGQKVSWLSLKPVTGRQHQLRAHMAIIGHPILGDEKYPAATATCLRVSTTSSICMRGGSASRIPRARASSMSRRRCRTTCGGVSRRSVLTRAIAPIAGMRVMMARLV